MNKSASIFLAIACAACKGGGAEAPPSNEPVTEPALTGFYRIDRIDMGAGMKPADALLRASATNKDAAEPEIVWNRMGMGFEGDSVHAQISHVIRVPDDAYPFALCTADLTAPVAWDGDDLVVGSPAAAESRFMVSDGSGTSTEVTCRVAISAGRFTVEHTDQGIQLVDDTGRVILVPDDPDPKPETHIPDAVR